MGVGVGGTTKKRQRVVMVMMKMYSEIAKEGEGEEYMNRKSRKQRRRRG